jgi:hypothetical protein
MSSVEVHIHGLGHFFHPPTHPKVGASSPWLVALDDGSDAVADANGDRYGYTERTPDTYAVHKRYGYAVRKRGANRHKGTAAAPVGAASFGTGGAKQWPGAERAGGRAYNPGPNTAGEEYVRLPVSRTSRVTRDSMLLQSLGSMG